MSTRRYVAIDQGQHPQTGRLLRRDAIFDANFGRRAARWVMEVDPKTPLTEGNPEPNAPQRGEPTGSGRGPQYSYSVSYSVFD